MALTDLILLKIAGDSSGGERALDRMNQRLRAFGAALSAVSAIGAKYIKSAAQTAARTEVLGTAMMVVAKRAGYGEAQISALEQRLKDLGITTQQARLNITRFIQAGLDLSQIEQIADAARNLAVIAGTNTSEAFETLTQAIATTNPRLLRQLNLLVSLNEVYGQNAASMSTAEKRQRLMNWIIAEGAKVSGVYEESMKDVGKAVTSLPRLFEEARNAIGKHFLPVWKVLVDLLSAALKWFEALPEPVQKLVAWGLALATAVAGLAGPLLIIVSFWPKIVAGFTAAAAILPVVIKIVLGVAGALMALIAAVKIAKKAWDENWGGIRDTVQFVVDTIKPHLDKIAADIRYWVGEIKKQLAGIMAAIRAIIEPALRRLRELFGDGFGIVKAMQFVRDGVNVVLSLINSLLETIRLLLEGKSEEAWKPLEDAAINVITLVVIAWRRYISKALTYGWNLVVQFANGIIRAANTVLKSAADYIGRILSRFLAPGSPPREGPLRAIIQWGKGLIDTFLRSFGLADFGILRDVLSPLRDALQSAVELGDVSTTDMLSIFRTVRAQVAGLIAEFRQTGEINEEIMASIAQRLGEGGREYMEYLRLTLEHQKALQNLKDVQDRVAEARERGFVPDELLDELEAAEEEARAKEEAVEWQREYLAALQDGVDLQVEMVSAMKELTEAMKGLAGAGEGAEGVGLPEGAGEEVAEAFAGFGGFSEEFERVKQEVREWFESLPGKIETWLGKARLTVARKWAEIRAQIGITLSQIAAIILFWFLQGYNSIRTTLTQIAAIILFWFLQAYNVVNGILKNIGIIITTKWNNFWTTISTTAFQIWFLILFWFTEMYNAVKNALADVKQEIEDRWNEAKAFLEGIDLIQIGTDVITGFLDGLKSAWESVKTWLSEKVKDLPQWLKDALGISSPPKWAISAGQDIVEGLKIGLDLTSIRPHLQASLMPALAPALAGGVAGTGRVLILNIEQLALPGIRDGRDAKDLMDRLEELADNAALRRFALGGLMG